MGGRERAKEAYESGVRERVNIQLFQRMEHARCRILAIFDCIANLTAAWKTSGRPFVVFAEHSKYLQCNEAATCAPWIKE